MSSTSPVVFIICRDSPVGLALRDIVRLGGWDPVVLASAEGFPFHTAHPAPSCLLLEVTGKDHAWPTVRQRIPGDRTPVILLARHLDIATVVKAMKEGVFEVFTTPFRNEAVTLAIREAMELSRRLLARETALEEVRRAYASLSPREREVMGLVVSGYLNKQVGGRLGISEVTVKAHRARVMQKMRAKSLPALVRMADGLENSGNHPPLGAGVST